MLSRDKSHLSRDKIEFKKWIACPLWATVLSKLKCMIYFFSIFQIKWKRVVGKCRFWLIDLGKFQNWDNLISPEFSRKIKKK